MPYFALVQLHCPPSVEVVGTHVFGGQFSGSSTAKICSCRPIGSSSSTVDRFAAPCDCLQQVAPHRGSGRRRVVRAVHFLRCCICCCCSLGRRLRAVRGRIRATSSHAQGNSCRSRQGWGCTRQDNLANSCGAMMHHFRLYETAIIAG